MTKSTRTPESDKTAAKTPKHVYKQTLRGLQVELVKPQRHFIASEDKILIINVLRDLLGRLSYREKDRRLVPPDPKIVSVDDPSFVKNGRLAK